MKLLPCLSLLVAGSFIVFVAGKTHEGYSEDFGTRGVGFDENGEAVENKLVLDAPSPPSRRSPAHTRALLSYTESANNMSAPANSPGGELVSGTPPDGALFGLSCQNPATPSATPPPCSFVWPEPGAPSWCSPGYHCFAVQSPMAQPEVHFRHSPALQSALNDQSVHVQIDRSQGLTNMDLRLTIYELRVLSFVQSDEIEVCFQAGSLEERCVGYSLQRLPHSVLLRVEGDDGALMASKDVVGHAYQSSLIFVRAFDFNRRDNVVIELIDSSQDEGVESPTSNLIFKITDALPRDQDLAATFWWRGETHCVDPDARPGFCPSGVWERVGVLKPKKHGEVYTAAFWAMNSPQDSWQTPGTVMAMVSLHNDVTSPSFLDHIISNREGIPDGSPLENQLVGYAHPDGGEGGEPRAYVNCPVHATLYAFNPNAAEDDFDTPLPTVALTSVRPAGLSFESTPVDITLKNEGENVGNEGLEHYRALRTDVSWTPVQGQEGRLERLCYTAMVNTTSSASTTRCFHIMVERCRYCTLPGDTLSSIAERFHTTWLQLWTANGDGQLSVSPGQVLRLGPTYTVKPLDSLDSLATRLHTDVAHLLLLNPDILHPHALAVGQQLCFQPDICPKL